MVIGIATLIYFLFIFFFNGTATTEIYTLSLHDALPIFGKSGTTQATATQKFSFDTSLVANDTVSELTALIEAVADWNADYVGLGTADTATIADFAETQIDGSIWLRIRGNGLEITYTGANAYAEISMTSGVLVGASGAGSGSAVTDWSFDTSLVTNDTLTELQVLINADPDYSCTLIGAGATSSPLIGDFTIRNITGITYFVGATKAWEHKIYLGGATDVEPSFTMLINKTLGANQSKAMIGTKCNSLALNISNREIIKASLDIVGKNEDVAQVDVSPTIIEHTPYVGNKTRLWENGYESQKSKTLTVNIANNLDVSGLIGSDFIDEPIKGGVSIELSSSENLDNTVYLRNYDKFINSQPIEILFNSEAVDFADSGSNTLYDITGRVRKCNLATYEANIGSPDRLPLDWAGKAVKSTNYSHIEIYVIDGRSAQYSA